VEHFDERGNAVEEEYDDFGNPVACRDGYARTRTKVDDRGNPVLVSYFDADGLPTRHKDGYARLRTEYDGLGRAVALAYLDEDGQPTPHRDGYAREALQLDRRGEVVGVAYEGPDGKPVADRYGVGRVVLRRDGRGNPVETAYLDAAGRPVRHGKLGYARCDVSFDEANKERGVAYFAEDDRPLTPHVVVGAVLADAAASKAGVREGDVLRLVDGAAVTDALGFERLLLAKADGDKPLRLDFRRGDADVTATLSLEDVYSGLTVEDRVLPDSAPTPKP
jgi:hypothetical protein